MISAKASGDEKFQLEGSEFERALMRFPDGYSEGHFLGNRWALTVRRSADHRRIWLYAEDRAGRDIVSFNLYALATGESILKPCEMSSAKVVGFVTNFVPGARNAD